MRPTDRFIAETTFPVRYAETDAMGIVHHASFIVYLEEARSSYARARGSDYADFERAGYFLVVIEINARYLKPARYGQRVTVACWIVEMSTRALTFGYEVVNTETGDLHMSAQTRHMCIRQTDGAVTRIPESWRVWADQL